MTQCSANIGLVVRVLAAQKMAVDEGTVGGLIFQQNDAKLVDVDTEVDVTQALHRIVAEAQVATTRVPAKLKALEGILGLGREA